MAAMAYDFPAPPGEKSGLARVFLLLLQRRGAGEVYGAML